MRDAQSYSTDVEGNRPVHLRYTLRGKFDGERFLRFIADRASWLSIQGWAALEEDQITVVAAGPEALVGALEMAVTLGPDTALVETIVQEDERGPPAEGFRIIV